MEYKSITQITNKFKGTIYNITPQVIQSELRKMGYLNSKNLPTTQAIQDLHYKEAHDIRGRLYYKWEQAIVDEVEDRLAKKYFFNK